MTIHRENNATLRAPRILCRFEEVEKAPYHISDLTGRHGGRRMFVKGRKCPAYAVIVERFVVIKR